MPERNLNEISMDEMGNSSPVGRTEIMLYGIWSELRDLRKVLSGNMQDTTGPALKEDSASGPVKPAGSIMRKRRGR